MVRVIEAKHVKDYVIWLRFQDGTEGEVDLKDELYGEVFEPLKNGVLQVVHGTSRMAYYRVAKRRGLCP